MRHLLQYGIPRLESDETEESNPPSKQLLRPCQNKHTKEPSKGTRKGVASFKRSLRLLGLSPTDLGLTKDCDKSDNCSVNTSKKSAPSVRLVAPITGGFISKFSDDVLRCRNDLKGFSVEVGNPRNRCCTPRPRLLTRLTRKSVSLDDVRKATPIMISDAEAHKLVADAVYEEWYFAKQSQILRWKRENAEEERRKAEQKALEKEELRRKSEDTFHKWLQRKIQQKRESQLKRARSAPPQRCPSDSRQAVTPEQASEAYHKWLEEKGRQKQQGKRGVVTGNRTTFRRQPDPERREEALNVYQHWKKEVDANRRKEAAEKRRKQEEEESVKRQKEQEKQEDARRSFLNWKSRKEQEIRHQIERKRMAEFRENQRQQEKKWRQNESASKAFVDWLDAIDERNLRAASMRIKNLRSR